MLVDQDLNLKLFIFSLLAMKMWPSDYSSLEATKNIAKLYKRTNSALKLLCQLSKIHLGVLVPESYGCLTIITNSALNSLLIFVTDR